MCNGELLIYGCGCAEPIKTFPCANKLGGTCNGSPTVLFEHRRHGSICDSCICLAEEKAAKHARIVADFQTKNPDIQIKRSFIEDEDSESKSSSDVNPESSTPTPTIATHAEKKAAVAQALISRIQTYLKDHERFRLLQSKAYYTTTNNLMCGMERLGLNVDVSMGTWTKDHTAMEKNARDFSRRIGSELLKYCEDVFSHL